MPYGWMGPLWICVRHAPRCSGFVDGISIRVSLDTTTYCLRQNTDSRRRRSPATTNDSEGDSRVKNLSSRFLVVLLLAATGFVVQSAELADAKRQPQEASMAGFRYLVFETGDAKPGQSLPLIVGLHYSSAKPETMLADFDQIDFPARIVLPQGTYPRRDGYSWFPPEYAKLAQAEQDAATLRVEAALSSFVDATIAKYPTQGKPVVMGISYGGDLTFLLAVRHPDQVQAAFPVAARFLTTWMPNRNPCKPDCPPIHAMHGEEDTTVPMAPTRQASERLRALGFNVELHPYPGVAHDFDARMKQDFTAKVRALLVARP